MRNMLIYTILLGVAFLGSGCSVKSTPPITEFALIGDHGGFEVSSKACTESTIKILEPFGSNKYTINDLYYVVLPYEENSYTQSTWIEPVATMLYNEILKAVRESGLFGNVSNYSSVARGDYILEIEINDFKQYFSHDQKESYAVSHITFTLVRSDGFIPIAQQEIYKKIKTNSLDAKGGVEALNRAQRETIKELITWLDGICQR